MSDTDRRIDQLPDRIIDGSEYIVVEDSATHVYSKTPVSAVSDLVTVDPADVLPIQTGNSGKYLTTNGSAPSWAAVSSSTLFNINDYGGVGDGTTNNTTALNNTIAAAVAAGGGTVYIPAGTYRCDGAITIPYTTLSPGVIKQKPIRITGAGAAFDGTWYTSPVNGGSILDLRYNGPSSSYVAKIDTRGAGYLEIDHVTFKSGGTDNYPILRTTNTTLFIHHNAFIGNSANTGTSCRQDAILLGGTNNGENSDDIQAGFQGYGTKIYNNYYSHIRSIVFQTYANAIEVQNETFSSTCGSNLAQGAPFRFQPMAGFGASGCKIFGGTVEMGGYPYVVALMNDSQANVFDNIGAYDDGGTTLAYVYCGASNCSYNYIQVGLFNYSKPAAAGDSATIATQTIIDPRSQASYFPGTLNTPTLTFSGGLGQQKQATIGSGGRIWSAVTGDTPSGGPMSINTGPGGSYFDLTAYSLRLYDHSGNLKAEIMPGKAAGAIRTGADITANRPSASTAGAGSIWFDTTLGKHIYSDGTSWSVAAGGSGITRSVQTLTSTATIGAASSTDYVVFIGASGAPTLPTAVGNTNRYTFKNVHSTNKTIATTSSQTIDGSTTVTITPNTSVDVISDNANWRIV